MVFLVPFVDRNSFLILGNFIQDVEDAPPLAFERCSASLLASGKWYSSRYLFSGRAPTLTVSEQEYNV